MKINEQLRPLAVPIASLTPDPENARKHEEGSIEGIKASLAEFGQQKPIVIDSKGVVKAGNGTLAAAIELGATEIAAVVYDGTGDLDAFALADNRTAELSKWDYRRLSAKLRDLQPRFDISKLGWKDYELQPLLNARWTPPPEDLSKLNPNSEKTEKLTLTMSQWGVIARAIAKAKTDSDMPDASDGRCIELICADFLGGV